MVLVFFFYLYASYRDQTQVARPLWQTPLPVEPSYILSFLSHWTKKIDFLPFSEEPEKRPFSFSLVGHENVCSWSMEGCFAHISLSLQKTVLVEEPGVYQVCPFSIESDKPEKMRGLSEFPIGLRH